MMMTVVVGTKEVEHDGVCFHRERRSTPQQPPEPPLQPSPLSLSLSRNEFNKIEEWVQGRRQSGIEKMTER